jgi:hypothetical protein
MQCPEQVGQLRRLAIGRQRLLEVGSRSAWDRLQAAEGIHIALPVRWDESSTRMHEGLKEIVSQRQEDEP